MDSNEQFRYPLMEQRKEFGGSVSGLVIGNKRASFEFFSKSHVGK